MPSGYTELINTEIISKEVSENSQDGTNKDDVNIESKDKLIEEQKVMIKNMQYENERLKSVASKKIDIFKKDTK